MTAERVQALALGGLNKLPAQFIRPVHERPENTVAVHGVTVPVISLSQPHDVVVKEVAEACQEWGFFLIRSWYITFINPKAKRGGARVL